ncbi:hypothetical protein ACTA71_011195 [Dictyostelium dimigraforme]
MGRTSKNTDIPQEEPLTVTRSGRTVKPSSIVTDTPAKQTKKTKKNQKVKESDEEDSSENEEQILETQKSNKKKKETTTVNRKEKVTTPKKKKQTESDDEDLSSSSATPPKSLSTKATQITTPAKKYTQEELDIITRENRNVYIKFFIFSILMVVVPLLVFRTFNTTIGDYLGISRQERVTYAGVASLGGLILVMAAYSIMAYYEK